MLFELSAGSRIYVLSPPGSDAREHVLIVPELAPDPLQPFSRLQKAVWWLSTFQSPFSATLTDPAIRHLCQSAAALDMTRQRGFD